MASWASIVGGKKQPIEKLYENQGTVQQGTVQQGMVQQGTVHQGTVQQGTVQQVSAHQQSAHQQSAQQQAARKREEEEKRIAAFKTRDNGFWTKRVTNRVAIYEFILEGHTYIGNKRLDVPHNVNKRAMEYVERYLVNFPELTTTCKTVGELKSEFCVAYMRYALNNKYKDNGIQLISKIEEQQYARLQKWVMDEEASYKARQNQPRPYEPWRNPLWVFGKNVTFENCLWAMNVDSKTFETLDSSGKTNTGFISVEGNPSNDDSKITWLTDLSTYQGIQHNEKVTARNRYD
jgi:hypothetical protein